MRAGGSLRVAKAWMLALGMVTVTVATAAAQQPPPPAPPAAPPGGGAGGDQGPEYFEEPAPEWAFDWGTDTTFTLSNRAEGSTNETNDKTTPFDALWMRLFGHLRYGDRAELAIDLFATESHSPSLFGLYGKVVVDRFLGFRVGLLPLVFGAWQDRAYPSRQPLIGVPLHSQYLLGLRNGALPEDLASLRWWRQPGYDSGAPEYGIWGTLAYEHCWDTGIEAFGDAGSLHYRVAVMDGTPGFPAAKWRLEKNGGSVQGRLTYHIGDALRLGASAASGSYLLNDVADELPAGTKVTDYRQDLLGGDIQIVRGPWEVNADYVFSRVDSPFTAQDADPARANLDTHGYSGELALDVAPGVTVSGRVSGLVFGKVATHGSGSLSGVYGAPGGTSVAWDDNVTRLEAGARYRWWQDHVALKAVYQRTWVESTPRRIESLAALQLVFSR